MDGADVLIDPHNEVRKLQELVKKLEKQNEVLRTKTPGPVTTDNNDIDSNRVSDSIDKNENLSEDQHVDKSREQLRLADLEDVDYLQLPDDEYGWLYKPSSKQSLSDGSEENLISWLRQDFDHPTPERESSKRALVQFIEDAARMKHSSSSPMLTSQSQTSKSAAVLSRSTEDSRSIGPPSRLASLQKGEGPAAGDTGRRFDTGTFTRPKRPAPSNLKAPFHGEGDQVQSVPNVTDIENLAKQQEESLRQSVTPAKNTLRNKHALADRERGARTSPSRFDVEGSYRSQHRGSFSSDQSTPPDSPHSNQHFQLTSSTDGRVRRNVPPGSTLQYRSHNSSDSSLERHSVDTNGSDEMNLAPEAMRAPVSRLQAPRNSTSTALPKRGYSGLAPGLAKQQQQQRGVSPQRQSGLPSARRQIARPSTAPRSSLPQFRRPVTPSARPAPVQSQDSEANWRDGCF